MGFEFDEIETPENVELRQPLAGIGTRFVAGFVDNMIQGLAIAGAALAIYLLWRSLGGLLQGLGWWALALVLLLVFVLHWGYFAFFEYVMNGQTPGKRYMRIRVVRDGGGAIGFSEVAIRNLLRVLDSIGIYVVAGVIMFFSRKGQRLGDLAAGTVVTSEETPDYSARTDKPEKGARWELEASPEALRATGLTPEEFRVLSNYYTRRKQLTPQARARLLPSLILPVLQRRGMAPPPSSFALDDLLDQWMMAARTAAVRARNAQMQPPPLPRATPPSPGPPPSPPLEGRGL